MTSKIRISTNTHTTASQLHLPTLPMRSACSDEIWIAEDDDYVRLTLDRAFRRCFVGAKPLFFGDGDALVEHCRSTFPARPKLVLLDLQMPVLDGFGALKTLHCSQARIDLPVVIFSSNDEPETVSAAYAAGVALYLKKPHRLEEFNDVARLCVTCCDRLLALRGSRAFPGALDVKEAVKLLFDAPPDSALSHRL